MAKKSQGQGLINTLFAFGVIFLLGNMFLNNVTSKLQYGKTKIKIKGITSNLGLLLEVIMPITNNNRQSFLVTDFVGELWYGPVRIATLDQRAPITLQALQTTDYSIEAAIDLDKLTADVKQQLSSGQYLQNFFLKGKMTVGRITVPINEMLTVLF